jgi:phytoene dehydrogenase-like protein
MDTRSDVVVVGGGLAGLAAAATAARAGASVTLLERSSRPGGRARTREQEGFLLNLGPHALSAAGAGRSVLRDLGVPVAGAVPPSAGLALRDGAAFRLPATPGSLLATRLLSPRAKLQMARLLWRIAKGKQATTPGVGFERWLVDQRLAPGTAALLRAVARLSTYAADLDRLDAAAALDQVRLALAASVIYVHGGWQSLVDGLRAVAEAAGARVVKGAPVSVIEASEGHVKAVRAADGHVHAAEAVVLAVPPDEAARLAAEISPEIGRAARAAVPVRAATLDLGLRRLPRPQRRFALGIDRPLYYSVHSATARLAPAGAALVHALMYLGPGAPDAPGVEAELERMMDLLQPGWRREVVVRRFVPELTASSALPVADRGGLKGRAPVRPAGVAGLLLAGDWVGPTGLLADASLASGREAGRRAAASVRGAAAA